MKLHEFIPLLRFDAKIYVEIKNHVLNPSYTGKACDFSKWQFFGAFNDAMIINMHIGFKGRVLVIYATTDNEF